MERWRISNSRYSWVELEIEHKHKWQGRLFSYSMIIRQGSSFASRPGWVAETELTAVVWVWMATTCCLPRWQPTCGVWLGWDRQVFQVHEWLVKAIKYIVQSLSFILTNQKNYSGYAVLLEQFMCHRQSRELCKVCIDVWPVKCYIVTLHCDAAWHHVTSHVTL